MQGDGVVGKRREETDKKGAEKFKNEILIQKQARGKQQKKTKKKEITRMKQLLGWKEE